MKIHGEFLSHLRFADDIFICRETPHELQHMLQELSDESRRMGLKMNITKTKVMVVDNTPIKVNNVLIENVQGYADIHCEKNEMVMGMAYQPAQRQPMDLACHHLETI